MRLQCVNRIDDKAHVRLTIFVERRGNAHDQSVTFSGTSKISGGLKTFLPRRYNTRCRDVLNVTFAGIEFAYLALVNINAKHAKPYVPETQHQRQPYIAKTYDTDHGSPVVQLFQ